jgi:hypothetical protein
MRRPVRPGPTPTNEISLSSRAGRPTKIDEPGVGKFYRAASARHFCYFFKIFDTLYASHKVI